MRTYKSERGDGVGATKGIVRDWIADPNGILVIPYDNHRHFILGIAEDILAKEFPLPVPAKKRRKKGEAEEKPRPIEEYDQRVMALDSRIVALETLSVDYSETGIDITNEKPCSFYLCEVTTDQIPFWLSNPIVAYSPGRI